MLVICESVVKGARGDLTLMVSLGKPNTAVLNISGERTDEETLKGEAERVLGILGKELGLG